MANPEHLEILRQGVEVWNGWRSEHEDVRPDLNNVDLSGVALSSVDLRDADLTNADLRGALFTDAKLRGADLRGADLSGANFQGADLWDANLTDADLGGANFTDADLSGAGLRGAGFSRTRLTRAVLRGADLSGAALRGTDLKDADFTNVTLGYTTFVDNDLGGVKGMESVEHFGPSSIGVDTIYKSCGRIPEKFLRGCGVPEDFIVYTRSLTVQPIQFYKSFISYSSKDQKFADRLYSDLQNKGVRCWLATENLKIGDRMRVGIDEAIRLHDKLLLVLSKHSVASDWVEQEVETALDRERKEKRTVLFPIRLDDTVMKVESGWPALIRNTRNIGDFRKWKNHDSYQKAFDRLLRDLKAEA